MFHGCPSRYLAGIFFVVSFFVDGMIALEACCKTIQSFYVDMGIESCRLEASL